MIVLLTLAAVLFGGMSAFWLLVAIVVWLASTAVRIEDTIRTFRHNWRNRPRR
jgi:hypothetical protein